MTVLEASHQIVNFFATHAILAESDLADAIGTKKPLSSEKAIFLAALDELEKSNFVLSKTVDEKKFWILYKPILLQTQNVTISLSTALQISLELNKYIEKNENKVNAFAINEQDIENILALIKK